MSEVAQNQTSIHSPFLPRCVLCHTALEDARRGRHAEGHPCTGEQGRGQWESQGGCPKAAGDEAERGGEEGGGQHWRNAHLHGFPLCAHWLKICTNNVIERLNREIWGRIRVVCTFPDGNSALMLVYARLSHVASTSWGTKRYMILKHLDVAGSDESDFVAG